jgi:hypothetical protein
MRKIIYALSSALEVGIFQGLMQPKSSSKAGSGAIFLREKRMHWQKRDSYAVSADAATQALCPNHLSHLFLPGGHLISGDDVYCSSLELALDIAHALFHPSFDL